jgi:hypothetical protein
VHEQVTAPKPDSTQRPLAPEVHWLSLLHVAPTPPPSGQFPGGAGAEHCASSGRRFTGTRPPSGPPDDPLLLEPLELLEAPLDDPLELPLDDPLPEPPLEAPPELLPELDASPPSTPASDTVKAVPPHPESAVAAATTSHELTRM